MPIYAHKIERLRPQENAKIPCIIIYHSSSSFINIYIYIYIYLFIDCRYIYIYNHFIYTVFYLHTYIYIIYIYIIFPIISQWYPHSLRRVTRQDACGVSCASGYRGTGAQFLCEAPALLDGIGMIGLPSYWDIILGTIGIVMG